MVHSLLSTKMDSPGVQVSRCFALVSLSTEYSSIWQLPPVITLSSCPIWPMGGHTQLFDPTLSRIHLSYGLEVPFLNHLQTWRVLLWQRERLTLGNRVPSQRYAILCCQNS